MPALTDPRELRVIQEALSEWNGGRGLRWKDRAREYVDKTLGISAARAGQLMFEHVKRGGKVSKCREEREGWKDQHDYHYDIVLEIIETEKSYFEMRLIDDSNVNPPRLLVVNAHKSN